MITLSKFLFLIIPCLVSVAFITLIERKILRLVGIRVGPNKVSFVGILQPIVDAVKLSNKEGNFLSNSTFIFYYISSGFIIFRAILAYFCLFMDPSPISFKFRILIFFLFLALNSLNSIIRGWSIFRKYSLIGRVRTVCQLISYEAALYLCLFFLILCYSSFDITQFSYYKIIFFILIVPVSFYIWLPCFLAELNRTPYDFSEGESELVSGFNTEFGSRSFTLIFLAEYANIILFSIIRGFLFFFSLTSSFIFFFFVIWIRRVLPRFRFDKLMLLSWKFFIPFLTLIYLLYILFFC